MNIVFYGDIETITNNNTCYRKVISTTPYMQLVIMSILPKEEIGMEKHEYVTQFIRIESGIGKAIINNIKYLLKDGIALVIPPNTWHNIINTSKTESLKLYSIYSPPEHPIKTVQKYKPSEDD